MDTANHFQTWAVVELMGHRRLAGRLTERQIAGKGFLQLDVPTGQGQDAFITQIFSPDAIYAIHPIEEQVARQVATNTLDVPVHRAELTTLLKLQQLHLPIAGAGEEDDDAGWSEEEMR